MSSLEATSTSSYVCAPCDMGCLLSGVVPILYSSGVTVTHCTPMSRAVFSRTPRGPLSSCDQETAGQALEWWRVGLYAGFCSAPCDAAVTIPLGRRLPDGSSGLPGSQ